MTTTEKIILSLIFLFIGITTCFPQTMTLTYTATHEGSHVTLDSILIENLIQGGDTILYAPDTVLFLDLTTGVDSKYNQSSDGSIVSQNYPNPFYKKTHFDVHLYERDIVKIHVQDIMGGNLGSFTKLLDEGRHSFEFRGGSGGYFFLTVEGSRGSNTIKMFNSGSSENSVGKPTIEYIYYQGNWGQATVRKKINDFTFNLGDELRYTGFTVWGSRYIVDIPFSNKTYVFQFAGNACPGIPMVTDIDGNFYSTVLIGSQCWMVENLKTTTYKNGIVIPNVINGGTWTNLTTGAYVWYDNDISYKSSYGALYNWYAVMDPNGLCPEGWHVPDNDDWDTLTNYIGGTASPFGNKLKACRQVNSPLGLGCITSDHPRWAEHMTHYGTDDYGFSAFPGGTRLYGGSYATMGYIGGYWSSTASTSTYGWLRGFEYNNGFVDVFAFYKQNGYSVRCVKD